MPAVIAFFTGGWMRWAVLAALLAVSAAFVRSHYIHVGREQVLAESAQNAVRIVRVQDEATVKVVDHYIKIKGATEIVTKYVKTEVEKYAETNTGMCLDADWRRVHDSAAANTLPRSRPLADGESREAASFAAGLWRSDSLGSLGDGNS